MTTVFKTSITSMERYVEDGFVYQVCWLMTADSGTCRVSRPGLVKFERVEGATLTEFEQLTEEDILAWVTENTDADYLNTITASMLSELAELTKPQSWATGLPWQMIPVEEQPPV